MKWGYLLCAYLYCTPTVVFAQINIDIPRNVDAGNIEEQMRERPTPSSSVIPEKAYTPSPSPEGAENIRFTLKRVMIEGMDAYPKRGFDSFYAGMLGKEISLADIYALADRIRRVYHDDGFVLTQVFVPEQKIEDGEVLISITEGYISRLRWDGEVILDPLVGEMAARITSARPFDGKILESVMLRLNELPGVTARAALEPLPREEAAEGAVGLAISVEQKRYSGSISFDDYSSRHLSVWQYTGRIEGYGLLTPLDRLNVTVSSSVNAPRLRFYSFLYGLPIHPSGTTISFGGSLSHTHPGFRLSSLAIFSDARSFNASITQPLIRSRLESLDIASQFSYRNQQTDVLDQRFSEDRLRTITLSGTYNLADSWGGANIVDIDIVQGLNILRATKTGTPMLSRAQGRSDFTKITFNASRLQGITGDFSVLVAATGQKASAALLSSEQFGFGGTVFGRGYDASEISGDEGIAGSAELRWQAISGLYSLQPFAFYDIGKVKDKEAGAESVSAASAGLGARMQWDFMHVDTNIAWPLTYVPATPKLGADEKDPRFNVSVGAKF